VMDGARYSETFGDSTYQYIPHLANDLAPEGVVNTCFYNRGRTKTVSGHAALVTGNYQFIENSGIGVPENPSIFQLWRAAHDKDSTAAWVISSKHKVEVVSNCTNPDWADKYRPSRNCGTAGLGTNNRQDGATMAAAKEILTTHQPELVLVNFIEPDSSGHANIWEDYLTGIVQTDEYIYQMWNFIQSHPFYKNTTTLFVTNDHGRHLEGINDGFKSHGDDCEGCQHVFFYAYGPDFKKNTTFAIQKELPDIAATIAEMLDFEIPKSDGRVMTELFK